MAKYAAYGTILRRGRGYGTPEVFDELAAVANNTPPNLTLDTDDVTTHDSTDAWEEHVATILRSGEATLDLIYEPDPDAYEATTGKETADAIDNSTDPVTFDMEDGLHGLSVNDYIKIDTEILLVTGIAGASDETITAARAQRGSTIASHLVDTEVFLYPPNVQDDLTRDMNQRVIRNFEIEYQTSPAVTVLEFSAYVSGVSPEAPHESALTCSITLKPSGEVDI